MCIWKYYGHHHLNVYRSTVMTVKMMMKTYLTEENQALRMTNHVIKLMNRADHVTRLMDHMSRVVAHMIKTSTSKRCHQPQGLNWTKVSLVYLKTRLVWTLLPAACRNNQLDLPSYPRELLLAVSMLPLYSE